jgi:S-DNA-T family DNA segregation ATPase FtsK/SpoIIIE
VAIDGWENCVHALDALDGGQTSACLLALISTGPTVGVSVVVTGHRELLAPRLSGSFSTRYALRFTDRSDYALLGLAPATAPACCPPGRGVRGGDSAVVQFAHEGSAPSLDAARSVALRIAGSAGVRKGSKLPPVIVRALPRRVRLADLVAPAGRLVLGVGGDAAEPVALDLAGPPIRMLITGPPGSGRTTLLHLLLHQAPDEQRVAVAAAPGSPLADIARACGTRLLAPSDKEGCSIGDATLLLVDDAEAFAGTPAESVLLEWIAAQGPRTATFATTSNAEVAVAHRGTVAELRRSRQGVVLCPRQSDGEPFGIRLPPRHGEPIPGRGVLIGGRRSSVPVPIQVAMACDVTPCAGIGGPSAGRTSP